MSSFKGFSEEDIKKLTVNTTSNKPTKAADDTVITNKRVLLKINKGQKNAIIKSLATNNKLEENAEVSNIPDEAKLSKSEKLSVTILPTERANQNQLTNQKPHEKGPALDNSRKEIGISLDTRLNGVKDIPVTILPSNITSSKLENVSENVLRDTNVKHEISKDNIQENKILEEEVQQSDVKPTKEDGKEKGKSLPEESIRKRNVDLEALQARQKLIEEQNRKRKEMLSKALADRTKKTHEETERLKEIQKEFKKLDAILSDDVNILRKQIEIASIEYMEAQKKYYRIEKEFLDAKLALHQKLERKELLTEHLCAIIEKNEERKAQKLNELLDKLNVSADESQNTSGLQEVKSEKKPTVENNCNSEVKEGD